jgi:hypothetical protein
MTPGVSAGGFGFYGFLLLSWRLALIAVLAQGRISIWQRRD